VTSSFQSLPLAVFHAGEREGRLHPSQLAGEWTRAARLLRSRRAGQISQRPPAGLARGRCSLVGSAEIDPRVLSIAGYDGQAMARVTCRRGTSFASSERSPWSVMPLTLSIDCEKSCGATDLSSH
jgi:hypothetical protein